jgi:hypothetical protein
MHRVHLILGERLRYSLSPAPKNFYYDLDRLTVELQKQ